MFGAQSHEALHAARSVRELLTATTGAMADLEQRTEVGRA